MILNKTRETVIAERFEECRTWKQQVKGMMFRKEVVPLVFFFKNNKHISLHSTFCPGAMDLVFLDDSWEVVELRSEWEKGSSYRNSSPAMFLLELPVGSIAQSRTQVGDIIHLVTDAEKFGQRKV